MQGEGLLDLEYRPVYPNYFADPFVIRVGVEYYAYGTGISSSGGRIFEVLHSSDLASWTSLGGALEPPTPEPRDYWAPEVAYDGERFYMYYSMGIGDKSHRIRVAHAEAPQGPFVDLGQVLTPEEPFAIDANPFQDDDGQWYLFYAKDFLEGERVGTALVVDRLLEMTQLEGNPRTVLRASGDWQLYQRAREMYGSVYDWYTLEGPFVVKRQGLYYCFYSGGNWQEHTYGVGYAVAEHPLGPWREPRPGPVVIRTVPGKVIGPGHNSVVVGPDGHDYLVYHAWDPDKTARRMCVSRLEWTPEGPCLAVPPALEP